MRNIFYRQVPPAMVAGKPMSVALHTRRDIAEHNREVRARISALPTYDPETARANKARPITHAYQTRLIDQCTMLLRVVDDFRDRKVYLVRRGSAIEVWAARTSTSTSPAKNKAHGQVFRPGMSVREWFRNLAARVNGRAV